MPVPPSRPVCHISAGYRASDRTPGRGRALYTRVKSDLTAFAGAYANALSLVHGWCSTTCNLVTPLRKNVQGDMYRAQQPARPHFCVHRSVCCTRAPRPHRMQSFFNTSCRTPTLCVTLPSPVTAPPAGPPPLTCLPHTRLFPAPTQNTKRHTHPSSHTQTYIPHHHRRAPPCCSPTPVPFQNSSRYTAADWRLLTAASSAASSPSAAATGSRPPCCAARTAALYASHRRAGVPYRAVMALAASSPRPGDAGRGPNA